MKNAIVQLTIKVPENVTDSDIEKMLNFKFLGHAISNEDILKFSHEDIDVEDYQIL